MSSAGAPVARAARDLGPEPRDEAARGRRRRTRSARRGCTDRGTRAPVAVPDARAARRPRPRSRRAARPRCPACTTPTASSHASTTGAQSAVTTASGSPARRGDRRVGLGRRRRRSASVATCTAAPCTWRSHTHALGSAQPGRGGDARPVRGDGVGIVADVVADVAVSYGAAETPPRRSLHQTRAGPERGRASGPALSAGTRGRRSRRRRGRARPRRRASPRRRARASSPTCAAPRAARPRSGRSRRRSR